jgi:hypothetical protein
MRVAGSGPWGSPLTRIGLHLATTRYLPLRWRNSGAQPAQASEKPGKTDLLREPQLFQGIVERKNTILSGTRSAIVK